MNPSPPWLVAEQERFVERVPSHLERLGWSADRIAQHQGAALRALLRRAVDESPYHRKRLGTIAPGVRSVDDLHLLPVMTKRDMMENFDDVCTDRRLTRAAVDAHLGVVGTEPALMADEYVPLASGGSSGQRGVFVRHRSQLPDYMATVMRPGLAGVADAFGWPPPFRLAVTLVAAPTAVHATCAAVAVTRGVADVSLVPVTLPFDDIVERVQASAPMLLVGYPTVIARLADRARDGGLSISPQSVVVTSEDLRDDLRARISAGFGVPPSDSFGTSEGLIGSAPPGSREFTFASDSAVVEFVDADDRPVGVGTPADHVLVTNLVNDTQPLIRYRLDDRMTALPPAAEHGHQRALVRGRNDELVRIGDTSIHPLVLRSAVLRFGDVSELQLRTAVGHAVLDVVATGAVDTGALEVAVNRALAAAGAPLPVAVRTVEAVHRDPLTGKAPIALSLGGDTQPAAASDQG